MLKLEEEVMTLFIFSSSLQIHPVFYSPYPRKDYLEPVPADLWREVCCNGLLESSLQNSSKRALKFGVSCDYISV